MIGIWKTESHKEIVENLFLYETIVSNNGMLIK